MNRRTFLTNVLKAGVGFGILPAATTYARTWSGVMQPRINPEWVNAAAPWDMNWVTVEYNPLWGRKVTRYVLQDGIWRRETK